MITLMAHINATALSVLWEILTMTVVGHLQNARKIQTVHFKLNVFTLTMHQNAEVS